MVEKTSGATTMTLQTRGSAAINKAQRRLASLKSIDENLDLGYGLTNSVYAQMIETVRSSIEAQNILVSQIDESRRNVAAVEKALADLTARMLSGVATKYGRNSNEYRKAGGSVRKSKTATSPSIPAITSEPPQPATLEMVISTNGTSKSKAQTV
jgi:hypothetical protein